ncbi:MAG: thiamine pyrophosphate-binding protein [Myxococcota bacterium]
MTSTQEIHGKRAHGDRRSPLAQDRARGSTGLFPARADESTTCVSDALAMELAALGVKHAFGVVGGGIAPFAHSLQHSPISIAHFRHEGGAAFAATEASLATGYPTVVFVTTGPGLLNALTGVAAARWEGAKVILVSGGTPQAQRGRGAFQETGAHGLPLGGLTRAGEIFNYAASIEHPDQLPTVLARLRHGASAPGAFVAHVSLPANILALPAGPRHPTVAPPAAPQHSAMVVSAQPHPPAADAATVATVATEISTGPCLIWVGFGARGAATEIRALAELLNASVMSSPRGKGVFPESHPLFLAVTGFGGPSSLPALVQAHQPASVLALGTRLSEFTSFWDPRLVGNATLIHVDLDPSVFGVAYPDHDTFGCQADIRTFVSQLVARLAPTHPGGIGLTSQHVSTMAQPELSPRRHDRVRPQFLFQMVQQQVVEKSSAIVITEAGNSFAWGTQHLRFETPGRYRTSTGFGSMGQATAGVVGAAIATQQKAVAIVGDGAMLMNNEISTAVRYNAPAVWVVLNDGQYGMIRQGMSAQGFDPVETTIPPTDFTAFARSMGAEGVRVHDEAQLAAALAAAMSHPGPFVVDVLIDEHELAPIVGRIQTLVDHGVHTL